MATYYRLLDVGRQFFDANGDPLNGGKLYTYSAGTTSNKTTYQDNGGASAHANPIILDSAGRLTAEVWGTTGDYKLKLDDSSDSNIFTRDDISPVNDTTNTASEWVTSGMTPTYVSGTSFTVSGDQTTTLHAGRRLKIADSGGTVYASVYTSTYSAPNTTLVLVVDAGDTIDSGISSFSYGLLSSTNPSGPLNPILLTKQATTSGTSKTFSIPSWAKHIRIMGVGVSVSGATDALVVRVGTTTTQTTGYLGTTTNADGATIASATNSFRVSAGTASAAGVWHFIADLALADTVTNTWAYTINAGLSNTSAAMNGAGSVVLASALDIVELATGTATDTFDAGFVSCAYW